MYSAGVRHHSIPRSLLACNSAAGSVPSPTTSHCIPRLRRQQIDERRDQARESQKLHKMSPDDGGDPMCNARVVRSGSRCRREARQDGGPHLLDVCIGSLAKSEPEILLPHRLSSSGSTLRAVKHPAGGSFEAGGGCGEERGRLGKTASRSSSVCTGSRHLPADEYSTAVLSTAGESAWPVLQRRQLLLHQAGAGCTCPIEQICRKRFDRAPGRKNAGSHSIGKFVLTALH